MLVNFSWGILRLLIFGSISPGKVVMTNFLVTWSLISSFSTTNHMKTPSSELENEEEKEQKEK